MTRRPLGWPAPWTASDGGGDAELQTDVMRFIAILALCLVAIFALVQAAPPESPAPTDAPAAAAPVPPSVAAPEARPGQSLAPPVAHAPEPRAPAETPARTRAPPPVAAPALPETLPAADAGFTLRFESDEALKALVARNDVGLYALQGERARRLHIGAARLEFWQASMPSAFHEMDAATVPGDVIAALARTGPGGTPVRWGVTLPQRLSQAIDRRLAGGGDGDLVISATGALRLE